MKDAYVMDRQDVHLIRRTTAELLRRRSVAAAIAGVTLGAGVVLAALLVAPDPNAQKVQGADTTGNPLQTGSYNGSTWEAYRSVSEGALLPSAARTATASTATQTNTSARGVALFLSVTAASGTGGLQPQIRWTDPISGDAVTLTSAPTTVTATGDYAYVFYPSATTAGPNVRQAFNGVLPRTWFVTVTAGDASSYTYSLGYSYLY